MVKKLLLSTTHLFKVFCEAEMRWAKLLSLQQQTKTRSLLQLQPNCTLLAFITILEAEPCARIPLRFWSRFLKAHLHIQLWLFGRQNLRIQC
jgi:hypothetical protein